MPAYALDLGLRGLADWDRGLTTRAVATEDAVSAPWGRRRTQRRRPAGERAPRPPTPGPKPRGQADADLLREAIRQTPEATRAERRDRLG